MQSSAKDFLMHVRYRTLDTHIRVTSENPAAEQIASAISSETGADPQTIKLLVSGHKDRMIRLLTTPTQTAQELGKSGAVYPADSSGPLCIDKMNACHF